jgi:hypothetical protein
MGRVGRVAHGASGGGSEYVASMRACVTAEGKPKAKLTQRKATQRQNWAYRDGERLSAYACPLCGFYHVGHKRSR